MSSVLSPHIKDLQPPVTLISEDLALSSDLPGHPYKCVHTHIHTHIYIIIIYVNVKNMNKLKECLREQTELFV